MSSKRTVNSRQSTEFCRDRRDRELSMYLAAASKFPHWKRFSEAENTKRHSQSNSRFLKENQNKPNGVEATQKTSSDVGTGTHSTRVRRGFDLSSEKNSDQNAEKFAKKRDLKRCNFCRSNDSHSRRFWRRSTKYQWVVDNARQLLAN
jgi:hypothetical protein